MKTSIKSVNYRKKKLKIKTINNPEYKYDDASNMKEKGAKVNQ